MFTDIKTREDLAEELSSLFTIHGVKNADLKCDIMDLFVNYISDTTIPALFEILLIMYEGDKNKLCVDMATVKLMKGEKEKCR